MVYLVITSPGEKKRFLENSVSSTTSSSSELTVSAAIRISIDIFFSTDTIVITFTLSFPRKIKSLFKIQCWICFSSLLRKRKTK